MVAKGNVDKHRTTYSSGVKAVEESKWGAAKAVGMAVSISPTRGQRTSLIRNSDKTSAGRIGRTTTRTIG